MLMHCVYPQVYEAALLSRETMQKEELPIRHQPIHRPARNTEV